MDQPKVEILDLTGAIEGGGSGAILSRETADLDLNLVRFPPGGGVAAHINQEVDVIVVVVAGEGRLIAGGVEQRLRPGQAVIIPRGVERAIQASGEADFAYLSLHRRRGRLWPTVRAREV